MRFLDYFQPRTYEVVEYANSQSEAQRKAREKLPFPAEGNPMLYTSYRLVVTSMYSLDTLDVTEFEAKITFTLSKVGKQIVRKDGLEDRLVVKKK